jgi:hypothetical protein
VLSGGIRREVLGLEVGPSEAEPFWTAFLRSLTRRGLRGVKLVVSDSHEGLNKAAAKVLPATWQRCRVHFVRNALAHVGSKQRQMVAVATGAGFKIRSWVRLGLLQAHQPFGRTGGVACGREDRLPVAFEDLGSMGNVLGVIGTRRIGDLELGAEKRGPELGNQLFEAAGLLAQGAVETMLGAACMRVMSTSGLFRADAGAVGRIRNIGAACPDNPPPVHSFWRTTNSDQMEDFPQSVIQALEKRLYRRGKRCWRSDRRI